VLRNRTSVACVHLLTLVAIVNLSVVCVQLKLLLSGNLLARNAVPWQTSKAYIMWFQVGFCYTWCVSNKQLSTYIRDHCFLTDVSVVKHISCEAVVPAVNLCVLMTATC